MLLTPFTINFQIVEDGPSYSIDLVQAELFLEELDEKFTSQNLTATQRAALWNDHFKDWIKNQFQIELTTTQVFSLTHFIREQYTDYKKKLSPTSPPPSSLE